MREQPHPFVPCPALPCAHTLDGTGESRCHRRDAEGSDRCWTSAGSTLHVLSTPDTIPGPKPSYLYATVETSPSKPAPIFRRVVKNT